jgi:iron complex transport system substrate-binding protein
MRIVSLLPSATEILFAIGGGDDVVGVTHECDFPEAAKALPHLTSSALPHAGSAAEIDRHVRKSLHAGSSLYHLNSELLERLAPDLIVTQELCAVCAVSYSIVNRAARRLTSDPRIISLEPFSLEDVYANIETLGALTGREEGARALIPSLKTRIDALKARVAPSQQRVLVLEWTEPPMSGGHWAPQLVEIAGGIPVLGNPGGNSQVLSWEQIAQEDPDVIIVAPCGFDLEKTQEAVKGLLALNEWNALRAVRSGNVALVDGNAYLNRPGPRLVDTTEIFADILLRHRPVSA